MLTLSTSLAYQVDIVNLSDLVPCVVFILATVKGLRAIVGGMLADSERLLRVCMGRAATALVGLVLAVPGPAKGRGSRQSRLGAGS